MPIIQEPTWWHAPFSDSEAWQGPFDTLQDAATDAVSWGNEWVVQARQALYSAADIVDAVDVERLIEDWAENSDMAGHEGETPFDHWTPSMRRSLEKHLRMAAAEWADAAGVKPRPAWMFHSMGEAAPVEVPHD